MWGNHMAFNLGILYSKINLCIWRPVFTQPRFAILGLSFCELCLNLKNVFKAEFKTAQGYTGFYSNMHMRNITCTRNIANLTKHAASHKENLWLLYKWHIFQALVKEIVTNEQQITSKILQGHACWRDGHHKPTDNYGKNELYSTTYCEN